MIRVLPILVLLACVQVFGSAAELPPVPADLHEALIALQQAVPDEQSIAQSRNLATTSNHPAAWMVLSDLLFRHQQLEDAAAAIQHVLKAMPDLPDALRRSIRIEAARTEWRQVQLLTARLGKVTDLQAADYQFQIQALDQQGLHPDAEAACRRALDLHPDDAALQLLLVRQLHAQNRLHDAKELLQLLAQRTPDNPGIWRLLAHEASAREDWTEAIAAQQVLRMNGSATVDDRMQLAFCYFRADRLNQAHTIWCELADQRSIPLQGLLKVAEPLYLQGHDAIATDLLNRFAGTTTITEALPKLQSMTPGSHFLKWLAANTARAGHHPETATPWLYQLAHTESHYQQQAIILLIQQALQATNVAEVQRLLAVHKDLLPAAWVREVQQYCTSTNARQIAP